VQVGKAIGQTRPQVEKCRGRLACNPAIAVSSAGCDTLKEAKYRPQTPYGVEGCNQMHFGGARVGETGVDAAIDQRLNQ